MHMHTRTPVIAMYIKTLKADFSKTNLDSYKGDTEDGNMRHYLTHSVAKLSSI